MIIIIFTFCIISHICESTNAQVKKYNFEDIERIIPDYDKHSDSDWKDKHRLWKNGIVYYEISDDFNESETNVIHSAMEHIVFKTKCIEFHPKNKKSKDYVKIEKYNNGCWSNIGRQGGKQLLLLQAPYCISNDSKTTHNVIHELGHILGLRHEHIRADRDKYIKINWYNIGNDQRGQFEKDKKYKPRIPYSYTSIMHYSPYAYSPNGYQTILPILNTTQFGSQGVLDDSDVAKIRYMYKCKGTQSYLH